MKIIKSGNMNIITADEGKHIRDINDVYTPATDIAEEHIPYYTSTIYVPLNFDINKLNELYVEEDIDQDIENKDN